MKECRIGVYGPVDSGKTSLIEKLSQVRDRNSIEEIHKITMYVSCSDRLFVGDKADSIREYDASTDSINDCWRLITLDNPGHTKVICNSLSTLPFVNIPLLILNKDSFKTDLYIKYLDFLKLYSFKKILIICSKIDEIGELELKVVHDKIHNALKSYSFEYKICDYSIFSKRALSNILEEICSCEEQNSSVIEQLNGHFIVLKSFDKNKPGLVNLIEDNLEIKSEPISGALIGGINYIDGLKIGESCYIGPVYMDLQLQNQKKEKTTTIKPAIMSMFRNSLLPHVIELGQTGTLELSCDASISAGDAISGSIMSREPLMQYSLITIKITKSYLPLNLKDKVLLNVLNMKLIGSVDSLGKKSQIVVRLVKPLPINFLGELILHKQTKSNGLKLQICALGTIVLNVVN